MTVCLGLRLVSHLGDSLELSATVLPVPVVSKVFCLIMVALPVIYVYTSQWIVSVQPETYLVV